MKKLFIIPVAIIVVAALLSGCCTTRTQSYKGTVYVPVYKNLAETRSGIKTEGARDLKNTGKIYIYGTYLFIVERGEGVHIYDDSDPRNPSQIAFLVIPGVGDIAVKSNILYADSYIDLVAFDLADPAQPKLVKRVESIFPTTLQNNVGYLDPEKGLLVDYVQRDTTFTYEWTECSGESTSPVYDMGRGGGVDFRADGNGELTPMDKGSTNTTGKGGSMARFTISKNYLYSVSNSDLQTFDVSIAENPRPWAKINIGWNIETIFPFRDKLFIGSQTGMFIYDNSTPWNPVYVSEFRHARGCDPVVANDKYAYVTLRSGTRCAGNENELHIVDITNLTDPKLIQTYPMLEPAGVGVDGTTLFVCDGKSGLKVFDVQNPKDIKLLDWESDMPTYDIIPLGKYAIVIGSDGLYQYDYSNPADIKLLSRILVKK